MEAIITASAPLRPALMTAPPAPPRNCTSPAIRELTPPADAPPIKTTSLSMPCLLNSPLSSAIHKAALIGVKELRPTRMRSAGKAGGLRQRSTQSTRTRMTKNFVVMEFIGSLRSSMRNGIGGRVEERDARRSRGKATACPRMRPPEAAFLFPIFRFHVLYRSAAFLRVEITFHVVERVGVVTQAVLHEIVGAQRHVEGQVFLHIGGDLGVLQSCAVAAGELFCQRVDVAIEVFVGHDIGNQTDPLRFDAS